MSELLSCPFCGGEAHTYHNNLWHVGCENALNGCVTMSAFVTEAEAIDAWNTRADAYTREDVEGAFVSGYSLGTLPVGSDPQWDENEQTVDEHMAELGWVRERTCHIVKSSRKYVMSDGSELFEDGCLECNGYLDPGDIYCSQCGAKVVEE